MGRLEELEAGQRLQGVIPGKSVTAIAVTPRGADAVELTYRTPEGELGQRVLDRDAEMNLAVVPAHR